MGVPSLQLMQTGDLTDRFLECERSADLYSIEINGVSVWERIRFKLYRKILNKKDLIKAGTEQTNPGISQYMKAGKLLGQNMFRRNPFFADQYEYLFWGHQRRKLGDDGYWWDIYSDPIYENSSLDYLHLEKHNMLSHNNPPQTDNIRYIDLVELMGNLNEFTGLGSVEISESSLRNIKKIDRAFTTEFDVKIDIVALIKRSLRARLWKKPLYRKLLQRVSPSVVVIVVSYNKFSFIEVCKDMNIPVVELQHGVLHDEHMGYHHPNKCEISVFPDYLLTWGSFWDKDVSLPISDDCVFPVGYPYLEQQYQEYKQERREEMILFISQETVGEELSKLAKEVDERVDNRRIIYKLHPEEYDGWREKYPSLVDTDIDVIDTDSPSLYSLLSRAEIRVGVSSTVLYEGLIFGGLTYIYEAFGWERMQSLIQRSDVKRVSSVQDFVSDISSNGGEISTDAEEFFAQNPIQNITAVLNNIKEGNEEQV